LLFQGILRHGNWLVSNARLLSPRVAQFNQILLFDNLQQPF
jgi:hypothetical protein